MSESNTKKVNLAAVKEVHFTVRERLTLAIYLAANVKPANREERRRFRRVFRELDLDSFVPDIEANTVQLAVLQSADVATYSLTGDTVDYLYDKLNAATQGLASLILGELEDRIGAVKDGSYATQVSEETKGA